MPSLYPVQQAPRGPAGPVEEPMSQSEQRAQRLLRIESFYDGLDSVDSKLDPVSRGQFQQMVGMAENGQEARAQAVNKAYVAYTQPDAREAIETQWPYVRQQVAKSLGINKPEVTDSELYSAMGQKVKAAQDERLMASELVASIQLSALEGGDDWLTAYQNFSKASETRPGFDPKHADDYRRVAEAAGRSIAQKAHAVGPAVKTVSGMLIEALNDPNPLATEEKDIRREAMIDAIMKLEPADRTLAVQLAAAKVAREQPAPERGGLEKAGESLTRGVKSVTRGAKNVTESVIAQLFGTNVKGELSERRQIWRQLASAYEGTVDPVKGQNVVTQGLLNISGMIPQLGLVANPLVGVPLLLASNKDARQGALQSEGVPEGQAAAVATVQAGVDTALQFVTSNMVFGRTTNAIATSAAKGTGELIRRVAALGSIEVGVLGAVTATQQFSPLIIQDLASSLSESVPGVNWERELAGMKHALPETIATLVPMVLLGTGAATFRESAKFRDYTADTKRLQAVGFTEHQAERISEIADPLKRAEAIREEWKTREPEPAGQKDAISDLDAELTAKAEESATAITTNPDGSYKVTSPDGTKIIDRITEPAEAQRVAEDLADRESDHAQALQRLAEAIEPLPDGSTPTLGDKVAGIAQDSRQMGIAAPMPDWMRPGIARARDMWHEIAGRPAFTPFKQALMRWVGAGQTASLEIRKATRQIERAVPERLNREGITAWLQANGDRATLEHWRDNSTNLEFKKGYEAALKLNPDQIKVAERLRDFYQQMLVKLQTHGLVDHGVENYVSQIWKRESPVTGKDVNPVGPRLVTDLKHAKERTFGSYFEGEQLGYKPVTKDISKLLALYSNSVSKVISTRQFIKELTTKKASDGRPLAAPFGNRALSTAAEGEPAYIKPLAKEGDTLDYKTIEGQPALTKWKWIGEHNGADAFLEGQLGLHPEIFTHVRNALGQSGIRKWYGEVSGPLMKTVKVTVHLVEHLCLVTKGTMLSLSPFHVVQEGTHGVGHLVNPLYNMPELNPADPKVRNAIEHGLMLAGDNEAMRHFTESVDKNLVNHIPVIGDFSRKATEWMFHEYIPQLKLKTYLAIKERNTKRYAPELASKTTTQGEIDYLSAQQANAAYGHLNYADLGRNPTFQHLLQIFMLAPDFLEARARFAGQAFKGLFTKAGQEQLKAMAVLGVFQWMSARILSKLLDDDWHFEEENMFNVVVGNRRYTMRSVPEDLWKLYEDPRRFAMGRVSPLVGKGIFQLGTGKNWRGEKVDYSDTFLELATAWVPIGLRSTPLGRRLTFTDRANPISPLEQMWGSIGIHISRTSPIAKAYELAGEWKKTQGIKEDTGVYPVSKYQALRYALEDGDADRAAKAIEKLKGEGAKQLTEGFHQSIFKPFTSSQGMDIKFKASLEEGDRLLIEHAEHQRKVIWMRFNLLQQQLAQRPSANN